MMHEPSFTWTALVILGAVHGINPAMGWLFAVSLGLQEQRRSAVWRSLGPLALGHAGAIVAALAAVALLGQVLPPSLLEWIVAAVLVGFGIAHLLRHRHPIRSGMRVGARELTTWSFLMASAHGAGLMAVPFLLPVSGAGGGGSEHAGHSIAAAGAGLGAEWAEGLLASAVHTGSYLLATGLLAVVVYEWMGLKLLRKAWINIDLLWAGALVVTGLLTLLV